MFYPMLFKIINLFQKASKVYSCPDAVVRRHVHRLLHHFPDRVPTRRLQRRLPLHGDGIQLVPGLSVNDVLIGSNTRLRSPHLGLWRV